MTINVDSVTPLIALAPFVAFAVAVRLVRHTATRNTIERWPHAMAQSGGPGAENRQPKLTSIEID